MTVPRSWIATVVAALVAAGCGGGDGSSDGDGSTVTAADRVDRCLSAYPDATRSDCEEWEADGQLADDGTHEGHEDM